MNYKFELDAKTHERLHSLSANHGLQVEDIIATYCLWLEDPENYEKLDKYIADSMTRSIRDIKKCKNERFRAYGWPPEYTSFFSVGSMRVVTVEAAENFILFIRFENGELRKLDCKPFIDMVTPDIFTWTEESFRRVYLDSLGIVSWLIAESSACKQILILSPDEAYACSVPVEEEES